jgi:crossover junction endodeoxyribonuclease RuvC
MLVCGVDPGLRVTGYALMQGTPEGVSLREHGVIRTPGQAALAPRLRQIHAGLAALLGQHRPVLVAVEDLFAAQRYPRTAILMGHVRGVACLAAAELAIEIAALPPAAVKQAIAGFGGASKAQIQAAVQRLLHRPQPLDPHISDAAAMALTALSRAGFAIHLAPSRTGPRRVREVVR